MDGDTIKQTLNLPRTSFSMKAKLAQKEPEIIRKWEETGLYQKIQAQGSGRPSFVLHDGPPYANGNIHLGTALNKILKDFIVRSKTMEGYRAPYRPGWDCHGLPIEIKVDKNLGEKKKDMPIIAIREECKKYALHYVGVQRDQFRRLGVSGEWEEPYLTLDPEYEGDIIRFLAAFFARGNVYKGKKPVLWCASCRTALAEAEIEYADRKSPSIYVKFPMISNLGEKYPELKGKAVSVLIWTTTPWTLPANLAIAFHPDFEYAAFEVGDEIFVSAKRLIPVLADALGFADPKILVTFPGKDMEGLKARHPFIDRESVFVLADYVTLDQGTGAVHTAPGHGQEDYLTGLAYDLDIYTPVDSNGCFTSEIDTYGGLNVFAANPIILADMQKSGSLLKSEEIDHSYPHCWRCKQPVIFRATAQWFIAMEKNGFRDQALEAIKQVRWIPHWGEERIAGMVSQRPDWCISRQRSWGVPIPAFTCLDCGEAVADEKIALWVADIFTREGSNAWFEKPSEELIPPDTQCPKCGSSRLDKENNILDVWFESGSSHGILGRRDDLPWPADVYIEGHDQYRGWFNSSLLVGVAAKGASPYKNCIIHGFVLDEHGRAMAKSLGNVIDPGEVIQKNGAEILRLWVAMLNYKEDARYGDETLQRLVEAYRKLRNTWRFLLGNVHEFVPDSDSLPAAEMHLFDRWALEKFARLGREVRKAYEEFEYHVVIHAIYNFFAVELSSYYLDVLKDRLYCSGSKSGLRRSAQTAFFHILRDTLSLMAPILPFTTEEAWEAMPAYDGKSESVHLELFSDFSEVWLREETYQEWESLGGLREAVLKELEKAREEKLIGNSLEAAITIQAPEAERELLEKYRSELPVLFIVSAVKLGEAGGEEIEVGVDKISWKKCQRCWNYSDYVGTSDAHPDFCRRCEDVVKDMVL
ncbi:MAG: isoleucine--tRNA ligase [Candidatus Aminicenantaceae bacterium]